mmetsp:Transcript_17575/g.48219  ORF Transcript_17575/g.48219 Transcript_17575/m.48219 type:complete len:436 (-) Transcript_17575:1513-2820(-)
MDGAPQASRHKTDVLRHDAGNADFRQLPCTVFRREPAAGVRQREAVEEREPRQAHCLIAFAVDGRASPKTCGRAPDDVNDVGDQPILARDQLPVLRAFRADKPQQRKRASGHAGIGTEAANGGAGRPDGPVLHNQCFGLLAGRRELVQQQAALALSRRVPAESPHAPERYGDAVGRCELRAPAAAAREAGQRLEGGLDGRQIRTPPAQGAEQELGATRTQDHKAHGAPHHQRVAPLSHVRDAARPFVCLAIHATTSLRSCLCGRIPPQNRREADASGAPHVLVPRVVAQGRTGSGCDANHGRRGEAPSARGDNRQASSLHFFVRLEVFHGRKHEPQLAACAAGLRKFWWFAHFHQQTKSSGGRPRSDRQASECEDAHCRLQALALGHGAVPEVGLEHPSRRSEPGLLGGRGEARRARRARLRACATRLSRIDPGV